MRESKPLKQPPAEALQHKAAAHESDAGDLFTPADIPMSLKRHLFKAGFIVVHTREGTFIIRAHVERES